MNWHKHCSLPFLNNLYLMKISCWVCTVWIQESTVHTIINDTIFPYIIHNEGFLLRSKNSRPTGQSTIEQTLYEIITLKFAFYLTKITCWVCTAWIQESTVQTIINFSKLYVITMMDCIWTSNEYKCCIWVK